MTPALDPRTNTALLASLLAGLSTAIGALPILFLRAPTPTQISAMLGFGAGVMIAAAAFTLVDGSFDLLAGLGTAVAVGWVACGMLLGAGFLWLADHLLPHEHFVKGHDGPHTRFVRGAWLFVFAITLHNVPEGLAVGIGFAGPEQGLGHAITSGIVLQNLPEGLIAATSLQAAGFGCGRSLAIAMATGLAEIAGGLLGILLGQASVVVIAVAMTFAAGAMLYVVGQEVIPESHVRGRERVATWGIVIGFLVMTVLDRCLT